MGNLAAKVTRRVTRPLKNFAVEARTERVLAKEKPTPAPWHPSTQEQINKLLSENPAIIEQNKNRDLALDERLKGVYVTSQEPPIPPKREPNKPLPLSRENITDPEMGYQEPSTVAKGKLTIRQALIIIGKHQQDPHANNAMAIAKEYTIHPTVAENIVRYFKSFDYYTPPKSKTKLAVKDYISFSNQIPPANEEMPKLKDGTPKT